jgi:NAD(P)-dependent dehydrogenase (short-subunit alcohol dehydrogenase family)
VPPVAPDLEVPVSDSAPSSLPLAGRTALVTGGGTGIGRACAEALLVDGASVVLVGRRADVLDEAVAALAEVAPEGATVRSVAADVADEAQIAQAVATAAEGGGLDIAVLSAGTGTLGPLTALPVEEWQRVIDVNLTGTFLALKHAASAMTAGGRGGAIVAISSIAGTRSHRWMGPYCATKAGIDALVEVAADELGRQGIRVCSVRPGVVSTDLGDHLLADPDVTADYLAQMPISRAGDVTDVAKAVRFLCGPESGWITGVALSVDGGHHIRRGPDLDGFARALYGDAAVDGPQQ